MTNEDRVILAWLREVPPQFKRGEGLKDDIGEFVHDFINRKCHGMWTRDALDTALGCFIASSSRYDSHYDCRNWQLTHIVTAEDCALLWGMGIRVDDDMADPK